MAAYAGITMMRFKMRAVTCQSPGKLAVEDCPAPGPPREGWALVRVSHVGMCRADYRLFEGGVSRMVYPRILGRDISGTVLMTGDNVALASGQDVIVNPYLACGRCLGCRQGSRASCEQVDILGVHRDGGLCERIVVPAANLHPADGLSLADAASVGFLAVGASAVRRSKPESGTRALVVGAGPIGLGTALFAKLAGLDVVIADHRRDRLDFAECRLGLAVDDTMNTTGRSPEEGSFDVVFDASGDSTCVRMASRQVAQGGTYAVLSETKRSSPVAHLELHGRRMKIALSDHPQRCDFDYVAEAIRNGLVPVQEFITHRTTLDKAPPIFGKWAQEKHLVIKAMIAI